MYLFCSSISIGCTTSTSRQRRVISSCDTMSLPSCPITSHRSRNPHQKRRLCTNTNMPIRQQRKRRSYSSAEESDRRPDRSFAQRTLQGYHNQKDRKAIISDSRRIIMSQLQSRLHSSSPRGFRLSQAHSQPFPLLRTRQHTRMHSSWELAIRT